MATDSLRAAGHIVRTSSSGSAAVVVHKSLRDHGKLLVRRSAFVIVLLLNLIIVSAYLPDVSKGEEFFQEQVDELDMELLKACLSRPRSPVLVGLDANAKLFSDQMDDEHLPMVGCRGYRRGEASRVRTRDLVLAGLLSGRCLRAVNTFEHGATSPAGPLLDVGLHAGDVTHIRKSDKMQGQLDFILANGRVTVDAWRTHWSAEGLSDHQLLTATVHWKEETGQRPTFAARPVSSRGWQPANLTERQRFKDRLRDVVMKADSVNQLQEGLAKAHQGISAVRPMTREAAFQEPEELRRLRDMIDSTEELPAKMELKRQLFRLRRAHSRYVRKQRLELVTKQGRRNKTKVKAIAPLCHASGEEMEEEEKRDHVAQFYAELFADPQAEPQECLMQRWRSRAASQQREGVSPSSDVLP